MPVLVASVLVASVLVVALGADMPLLVSLDSHICTWRHQKEEGR
jgi:hypothetical protein